MQLFWLVPFNDLYFVLSVQLSPLQSLMYLLLNLFLLHIFMIYMFDITCK